MSTFIYRSTDAGAPAGIVGNTSTGLAAVLRGCLINGYNTQTGVTSTQTSGTATFTKTAHGYALGQVLTITGFTTTGYNLTKGVVLSVPSSSTWTMTVAGGTASPGVGTGTVIVAAADWSGSPWTEPYSAAGGISVFRSPTSGANGFCYRLDENTSNQYTQFRGYEVMTGLSTGNTNPFPTLAQVAFGSGPYIIKSSTNDSTARRWELFTNGKFVILMIVAGISGVSINRCLYYFGDARSIKSGDAYNSLVRLETTAQASSGGCYTSTSNIGVVGIGGAWTTRKSDQTGTAITTAILSTDPMAGNALGSSGLPYPNGPDGGFYLCQLNLYEASNSGNLRGSIPGLWNPCHAVESIVATNDTLVGTGTLAGKTFEFFAIQYQNLGGAQCVGAIETSDTWNS